MAVKEGSEFELYVEIATLQTLVNDIDKYNKARTRATTTRKVFARASAYAQTATPEEKYSVSGIFNPEDPGQAALLAAEASNSPVVIQILYDGTKGFTQQVKVGSFTHDANPDGYQDVSYEFTANAAATVVAGGVLA